MAAAVALQADVRAESDHGPLVAAARVRLPQLDDVADEQFEWSGGHGVATRAGYISPGIFIPPVRADIFSSAIADALVIAS